MKSSLEERYTVPDENGRVHRPPQDFVAIKRVAPVKKIGSIIVPETVAESHRPFEGKVVAVGPGRFRSDGTRRPPPPFKCGDYVYFDRYSAAESGLEDPDFWLVRENEIIAVLDP